VPLAGPLTTLSASKATLKRSRRGEDHSAQTFFLERTNRSAIAFRLSDLGGKKKGDEVSVEVE
jgi:hypothetical protein